MCFDNGNTAPDIRRRIRSIKPASNANLTTSRARSIGCWGLIKVYENLITPPVIVGNSIRLASEVESGDALG
jgi:hypothetical protein